MLEWLCKLSLQQHSLIIGGLVWVGKVILFSVYSV